MPEEGGEWEGYQAHVCVSAAVIAGACGGLSAYLYESTGSRLSFLLTPAICIAFAAFVALNWRKFFPRRDTDRGGRMIGLVELVILVANVVLFLSATASMAFLPDTIARHWSSGEADVYGGRAGILYLPLISSMISLVSIIASRALKKLDPVNGEVYRYIILIQNFVTIAVCGLGIILIVAFNV